MASRSSSVAATQRTASSSAAVGSSGGFNAPATSIPTSPANGTPESSTSSFPLPAIICVAVIGGILLLVGLYKLYTWSWARRNRDKGHIYLKSPKEGGQHSPFMNLPSPGLSSVASPPLMQQRPSYVGINSTPATRTSSLMTYTPPARGDSTMSTDQLRTQGSWRGSVIANSQSRNSVLYPTSTSRNSIVQYSGSRNSIAQYNGSRESLHAHPSLHGQPSRNSLHGAHYSRESLHAAPSRESLYGASSREASQSRDRRTSSMASLTVTPRRHSGHRLSNLPHARHSRIDIVPPMPLAPPPGAVVATDKHTLAFTGLSSLTRADGQNTPLGGSNWFINEFGQQKLEEPKQRRMSALPPSSKQPHAFVDSRPSHSTTKSASSSSEESGVLSVETSLSSSTDRNNPVSPSLVVESARSNARNSNSGLLPMNPLSPLDILKTQLDKHAESIKSATEKEASV